MDGGFSVTNESPKNLNRKQSNTSIVKPPQIPRHSSKLTKDQLPPAGKATGQPSLSPSPHHESKNRRLTQGTPNLKNLKSAQQFDQLRDQAKNFQAFTASPIKGSVPEKIQVSTSNPTTKVQSHHLSQDENQQPKTVLPPSEAVKILTNPT